MTEGLGGYVTLQEAARLRGRTYYNVRYLLRSRRLPHIKMGNTLLVRLADVDAARKRGR